MENQTLTPDSLAAELAAIENSPGGYIDSIQPQPEVDIAQPQPAPVETVVEDVQPVKLEAINEAVEPENVTPVVEETQPQPESTPVKEVYKPLTSIDNAPLVEAEITEELKRQEEEGIKRVTLYNVLKSLMDNSVKPLLDKTNERLDAINKQLKNVSFDPSQVIVKDYDNNDPLSAEKSLSYIGATVDQVNYPIIAMKSGYRAWMAPLTNNEKVEIRNVRGTVYERTNAVLRVVHRKIVNTSLGKLDYQRWLNITADEDLDTFLFGLFAATYPNPVEYEIECPKCESSNTLKLGPNNLIEAIDKEETGNYIQNLLDNYDKGEGFAKESLVRTVEYVTLNKSRIAVAIRTPSLSQMLHTTNLVQQKEGTYQPDLIQTLKFIHEIYVPDLEAFHRGSVEYTRITERGRILDILNTMDQEDFLEVRKAAIRRIFRYMIEYRIGRFNCAKCGHEIKDVSMDMTRLLFTSTNALTMG